MIYRRFVKCDVFKFQQPGPEIKENFRYQKGIEINSGFFEKLLES